MFLLSGCYAVYIETLAQSDAAVLLARSVKRTRLAATRAENVRREHCAAVRFENAQFSHVISMT